MNTKQGYLIRRPHNLPQKQFNSATIFDRFFDILRQRSSPIELPDFFIPQMDIHESDRSITLEMELPGMAQQDFAYRVDGDIIHIRGEKRRATVLEEGMYTRSERRYGLFERVLRLPAEVTGDQTTTAYENGILKITLTKKLPADHKEPPFVNPTVKQQE